jgi:cold shock CspA family protein
MADSKMTDTTSSQDFDESTRYFGRVKWFNNKAGYGFCTVVGDEGDERVGEDIFAHHTGVKVGSEQYKYLVQGEYVQFNLRSSDSTTHPYQAAELVGPWGGKLMCETRNDQRQQRAERDGEEGEDHHDGHSSRPPRDNRNGRNGRPGRGRTVRLQGAGPREGETWTLVREDKKRPRRNYRDNNPDNE